MLWGKSKYYQIQNPKYIQNPNFGKIEGFSNARIIFFKNYSELKIQLIKQ